MQFLQLGMMSRNIFKLSSMNTDKMILRLQIGTRLGLSQPAVNTGHVILLLTTCLFNDQPACTIARCVVHKVK